MDFHDRLDLKQDVAEYSSPTCGSVARSDIIPGKEMRFAGKSVYCCSQCPTLKADLLSGKAIDFGILA